MFSSFWGEVDAYFLLKIYIRKFYEYGCGKRFEGRTNNPLNHSSDNNRQYLLNAKYNFK